VGGEPERTDPRQAAADVDRAFATFATWVLIGWALLVVTWVFQFVFWGDCMFDGDNGAFCEKLQGRFRLANGALQVGAVLGAAVSILGCWIWPRRWRAVWVVAGFLSSGAGLLIATA
jgi:hypothetical protein